MKMILVINLPQQTIRTDRLSSVSHQMSHLSRWLELKMTYFPLQLTSMTHDTVKIRIYLLLQVHLAHSLLSSLLLLHQILLFQPLFA